MTHYRSLIQMSLLLALCATLKGQTPVFTELTRLNPYPRSYWGLVQGLDGQLYSTTAGPGAAWGKSLKSRLAAC